MFILAGFLEEDSSEISTDFSLEFVNILLNLNPHLRMRVILMKYLDKFAPSNPDVLKTRGIIFYGLRVCPYNVVDS